MNRQKGTEAKSTARSPHSTSGGDRPLRHNWVSMGGIAIGLLGLLGALTIAVGAAGGQGSAHAYAGLGYVLMAMVIALGAAAYGGGIVLAAYRRKRGTRPFRLSLMTIDLNTYRGRNIALAVLVVAFAGVGAAATASYQSVHYVESDDFCSNMCHAVMSPEGIAHETTSHAKVPCVSCHVGQGAESFVQAKISGMRQLWAVATGDYSRPIPTPIHNMRPARETCETCHWSGRFSNFKEHLHTYYSSDEENSPHRLRLLVKVGGSRSTEGTQGAGIHFHMTVGRKVEFISRDFRKQEIAWIRVTDGDGTVREFASASNPLTDEEKATLPLHRMDCLDCHNRPAHQFDAPMPAMNDAMELGLVDASLPFIKLKGVEVLSAEYATGEEANQSIETQLREYYASEYPDVATQKKGALDRSITAIQDIARRNIFPEMKARWSNYPDNIGHMIFPGCFRCHSDDMVNAEGEAVFSSCNSCHLVLGQGADLAAVENAETNFVEGEIFHHFADDEEMEEYTACVDCHTGGADTY